MSQQTTLSTGLMRLWRRRGWLIIGALWGVALALGYLGFSSTPSVTNRGPLDLAYQTFQLIPLNSGDVPQPAWQLQIARYLIPLLAAWTIARALLIFFHNSWQQLLMSFWRGHIVICGLSRKGWLLTRSFLQDERCRVVVIESNAANDLVEAARERGATVLFGNAATPDLLRRAGVDRARHVVIVTDDDGVNVEVAIKVADLMRSAGDKRRTKPLTCTVHLVDPQLVELARAREMAAQEHAPVRFELFNVYNQGARVLWNHYGPGGAAHQVDHEADMACKAHVLVVGLGRLGQSLVVTAARDWHAQILQAPCAAQGRLRVTVIDQDAAWKCRALSVRYPQLADVCDLAPISADVRGPEFVEGGYLAGGGDFPAVGAVYVCFDDDSLSLRVGLAVHRRLRDLQRASVPVVVRMAESAGLARLLDPAQETSGAFDGLHAFGLLDGVCTAEVILGGTHESLARSLHEAYVQRQLQIGQTPADNPSLVAWKDLPDEIRESNRAEADAIYPHLRALGYDLAPLTDWDAALFRFSEADVERLAEMEHTRWVAERTAAGWRFSPTHKDVHARLSPALVAWPELAEGERTKCRTSAAELPANLARAGFQIVRVAPVKDPEQ